MLRPYFALLCLRVFAARANLTCDVFKSKGDRPVAPTCFLRTLRSLRPISESEFSFYVLLCLRIFAACANLFATVTVGYIRFSRAKHAKCAKARQTQAASKFDLLTWRSLRALREIFPFFLVAALPHLILCDDRVSVVHLRSFFT